VRVDAEGMVVSELAAANVDAVVMTPAHQYPISSIALSLSYKAGKRVSRKVQGRTKTEVKAKLRDLRRELDQPLAAAGLRAELLECLLIPASEPGPGLASQPRPGLGGRQPAGHLAAQSERARQS
jgi:hypothetical protein